VAGELALAHDDYVTAVNRAYYATFYSANALLSTKGLERSKHSGVIAAFRQHFSRRALSKLSTATSMALSWKTALRATTTWNSKQTRIRPNVIWRGPSAFWSAPSMPYRKWESYHDPPTRPLAG
jgi:uncharacterized protein (UPF0332 family)